MDSQQKKTIFQDLPPRGGYEPFDWVKKAPPFRRFWGYKAFGTLLAISGVGGYMFLYHDKPKRWSQIYIEPRDQLLATLPLIWAEQDREFLRVLHNNREAERELMKDEPGWVVGTWYGEPIYYQRDVWVTPNHFEQYAHNHWRSWYNRLMEHVHH